MPCSTPRFPLWASTALMACLLAACDIPEGAVLSEPVALERSTTSDIAISPAPIVLPTPGNPGRARAGVVTVAPHSGAVAQH